MLLEPSTLNSVARVVADTLEADYGLVPPPVFAAAGLDLADLHAPRGRYAYARMQQLWQAAAAATGDPGFGLRAGARVRPATFSVLGAAWMASGTLHEALHRLCRYGRVISTGPQEMRCAAGDGRVSLLFSLPAGAGAGLHVVTDALFAAVLALARMVADPRLAPREVTLPHDGHGRAADYAAAFGCPVRFGAVPAALAFDARDADARLPGHDAELARDSELAAERYLRSIDAHPVIADVRRHLAGLLSSGDATLASVAARLNRSTSTLQRQLQEQGITYREILEQTRRLLAEAHLSDPRLTLNEIAFLLGFADQSSFSRAFRRWSGRTPAAFRRSARDRRTP